jgi:uncharacterized membrane protein
MRSAEESVAATLRPAAVAVPAVAPKVLSVPRDRSEEIAYERLLKRQISAMEYERVISILRG